MNAIDIHTHIVPAEFPAYAGKVSELGLERRVKWLGRVSSAEMPALFASASLVVYPSFYEGFGFPPLEAMAVGTPVVAANRGSLPEVLGDGALLVDPADERALAEAIEAVLTKPDLRAELQAKGKRRAGLYTWENCADQTVAAYRDVLGRTP